MRTAIKNIQCATTRLTIIFMMLIAGHAADAQKFTVTQLLSLYDLDKNKFDTYVVGKGYSFYKTEETEHYKRPIYTYEQKDELTSNYISFFYYNDSLKLLQYNTTNKDYYLAIKKQLDSLSFKYSPDNTSQAEMQS